jgi:UPF0755 protein
MKIKDKAFLKKKTIISAFFLLIITVSVTSLILGIKHFSEIPFSVSDEAVTVEIPQGTGLVRTSILLENKKLIRSALLLRAYAVMNRLEKKIRAGEYELKKNMSIAEILKVISEGKVKLHKIVIPEGFTLLQIAEIVDSSGITGGRPFLETASDITFIGKLGINADSLEGYLFPETYFFPKNTSPEKIIRAMTAGVFSIFTPDIVRKAKSMGFTIHETLTLASIIEKETGSPGERPLISSVFHNRLKAGMRLETDPTVIYGIKNFGGNLTRNDLETPTPYNTYIISGLPPGPISSPGKAAIMAALFPADTNYLYFVSKNDSTHFFSSDYRDHLNAVRQYQMRRKNNRDASRTN